ncbi:MAG TPA: hypothetical protein VGB26_08790 [Nitrospiria bacterium]|jgi:hypothetical protein
MKDIKGKVDHLGVDLILFDSLRGGDDVYLFGEFDSLNVFQAKVVVVDEEDGT